MPATYTFQVSLPVTDVLPRNRFVNAFHMEHVAGSVLPTDLEDLAGDIIAMYQSKYGHADKEVSCKVYDVGPTPNYPLATVTVNAGIPWVLNVPRELSLCLSFAGENKGNRNERGRIYLSPHLNAAQASMAARPSQAQLDWALSWYTESNNSFPDLGGVDWKFGIWSRTQNRFTQSEQAWCNDDWDIQRRRGLRESTRVAAQREG